MSNSHRAEKVKLLKRVQKGRRLCQICLQRGSGKNIFARIRRGTC